MLLFITSEAMFFFAFFWGFFHSSLSPVFNIGSVWPPKEIFTIAVIGIPVTNTILLLSSGATVTWGHHAIVSSAKKYTGVAVATTILVVILFTLLQGIEYGESPFIISVTAYMEL